MKTLILAAILAAQNFDSSESMIEAKRGWANTISTKQDFREITEGLGARFEAALNLRWSVVPAREASRWPARAPIRASAGNCNCAPRTGCW